VRTLVPIVCIVFSEEETVQTIFLIACFYWITFLLCQRVPYYNPMVGKIMTGSYSVLLWCSMCLMLAVTRTDKGDNSSVPSIVMASGAVFAFIVGFMLYKKRDDGYMHGKEEERRGEERRGGEGSQGEKWRGSIHGSTCS
jgi:hypothetical protein